MKKENKKKWCWLLVACLLACMIGFYPNVPVKADGQASIDSIYMSYYDTVAEVGYGASAGFEIFVTQDGTNVYLSVYQSFDDTVDWYNPNEYPVRVRVAYNTEQDLTETELSVTNYSRAEWNAADLLLIAYSAIPITSTVVWILTPVSDVINETTTYQWTSVSIGSMITYVTPTPTYTPVPGQATATPTPFPTQSLDDVDSSDIIYSGTIYSNSSYEDVYYYSSSNNYTVRATGFDGGIIFYQTNGAGYSTNVKYADGSYYGGLSLTATLSDNNSTYFYLNVGDTVYFNVNGRKNYAQSIYAFTYGGVIATATPTPTNTPIPTATPIPVTPTPILDESTYTSVWKPSSVNGLDSLYFVQPAYFQALVLTVTEKDSDTYVDYDINWSDEGGLHNVTSYITRPTDTYSKYYLFEVTGLYTSYDTEGNSYTTQRTYTSNWFEVNSSTVTATPIPSSTPLPTGISGNITDDRFEFLGGFVDLFNTFMTLNITDDVSFTFSPLLIVVGCFIIGKILSLFQPINKGD